jgi:hypothetical protein
MIILIAFLFLKHLAGPAGDNRQPKAKSSNCVMILITFNLLAVGL